MALTHLFCAQKRTTYKALLEANLVGYFFHCFTDVLMHLFDQVYTMLEEVGTGPDYFNLKSWEQVTIFLSSPDLVKSQTLYQVMVRSLRMDQPRRHPLFLHPTPRADIFVLNVEKVDTSASTVQPSMKPKVICHPMPVLTAPTSPEKPGSLLSHCEETASVLAGEALLSVGNENPICGYLRAISFQGVHYS